MNTKKRQTKTKIFLEKYGNMLVYLVFLILLGVVLIVLFFPLLSLEQLKEHFIFFKEMKILVRYFFSLTSIFVLFALALALLINEIRKFLGILTKNEKELEKLKKENEILQEKLNQFKNNF
ncbi:MAG: hypothetical protein Q3983_07565 [Capnocytophaga sp.]|nr:hypothetical protein [Capnocytophaga sp.]